MSFESPYWIGFAAGTWGLSWGGGDVEVEEHPGRYYGNGTLKPYREKDPFLSDEEHLALVREKWDAIEKARATDKESLPVADHFRDATKKVEHFAGQGQIAAPLPPSIISEHWPVAADEIAAAAMAKAMRQAREDEALLLVLAELL